MTTAQARALPTPAQQHEKEAIGMVLTFSGIGDRRKVKNTDVDVKVPENRKRNGTESGDADKNWLAVSKKLFDSDELDVITGLDGEIRQYLETRALPSNLKKGIYLMPLPFVEEVETRLAAYAEQRAELVNAFVQAYNQSLTEARERLRDLFDPTDYKTIGEVRRSFSLTWQYVTFDTPASLATINKHLFEQEKKKAAKMWEQSMANITECFTASLAELVEWMVKTLEPGEDGKRKVIRDASIAYYQDFLDTFDIKNLPNDQALKSLAKKARDLLKDVSPERLRQSASTRQTVAAGFAEIKETARAHDDR